MRDKAWVSGLSDQLHTAVGPGPQEARCWLLGVEDRSGAGGGATQKGMRCVSVMSLRAFWTSDSVFQWLCTFVP